MELVSNLVVRDSRITSICFSHTHFHIFTCKKTKLYPCKAAQAYAFTVSGCCSQLTSERKIFFTALLNRNLLYAIVYPKDCTTVLNQLFLPRYWDCHCLVRWSQCIHYVGQPSLELSSCRQGDRAPLPGPGLYPCSPTRCQNYHNAQRSSREVERISYPHPSVQTQTWISVDKQFLTLLIASMGLPYVFSLLQNIFVFNQNFHCTNCAKMCFPASSWFISLCCQALFWLLVF